MRLKSDPSTYEVVEIEEEVEKVGYDESMFDLDDDDLWKMK